MPLPEALLARLKQRGIVKDQSEKKAPENEEEVFAEDYDESESSNDSNDDEDDNEHSENSEKSEDSLEDSDESESEDTKSESLKVDAAIREHVTKQKCPNSKNPYHECSAYCLQKYGSEKKFEPHPVMERRRLRMLKIYPLLPNWREVPDYNTYYYWNIETDQVCWLSPSHPKAKYSSAVSSADSGAQKKTTTNENTEDNEDIGLHASLVPAYHDSKPKAKPTNYKPYNKHKKGEDALDPMDPASYSDIKRGKWSDGMDSAPSAKIGSSVEEN